MGETDPQTIAVGGETYEYSAEKSWRDADLLETLYWDHGMSQRDVGDLLGCSKDTVGKWMDKLDVDVRTPFVERPPTFRISNKGYERWSTDVNGEKHRVRVHRLLAVAKYGFDAVADMDVHHINHIPWDNRPENIALKTPKEHGQYHRDEKYGTEPWRDKDKLRELYAEEQLSMSDIAEKWGCNIMTISKWLNKHNIEIRSPSEERQLRDNHSHYPWQDKENLHQLYVEEQLSMGEIAEKWGCSLMTISNWLNKHDIQTRSQSEAAKLRHGDNNQQTLAESVE